MNGVCGAQTVAHPAHWFAGRRQRFSTYFQEEAAKIV
jgi:hypothetical protein